MTNIENWKQANSDISFPQEGSSGAGEAALVTGAKSGVPMRFPWQDVRFALSRGSIDNPGVFTHFLGNQGLTTVPAPFRSNLGGAGAVAVVADALDGQLALTSENVTNDWATVALGVNFTPTNGFLIAQFAVKVDSIVTRVLEIGIGNVMSEADGLLFTDHSVSGVTATATNAAIFAFDTDAGANWLINTSKASAEQAIDTGIPVVAAQWYALSLVCNDNGDIEFYIDGDLVATITDAVTSTVNYTPWVSEVTRDNVAIVTTLDYLGIVATA